MKKQILQLALLSTILLSGCTKKNNIHIEDNTIDYQVKDNIINPTDCTQKSFYSKIKIKQEEQIGTYLHVKLCKNSFSSIDFIGKLTKEHIYKDDQIITIKEVKDTISYYDCNTEEAKKAKYKNLSICNKNDGFSEFNIMSIDSL